MLRPRWVLLFAVATALTAQSAAGAMQLDRNVVYFNPSDPDRQDVLVRNPDPETIYLEIEVLEVYSPGGLDEQRIGIVSPRDGGLLVTPNKLVVPAGGQRLLRFVSLGERGLDEQVFRVNVTPKIGEVRARTSAIKVLVAYQVLVIVAPETRRHDLVSDRSGGALEFENLGNSNVLLYRGIQCADPAQLDTAERQGCRQIRGTRLYAGNRWRPELPYDTPVEFVVKASGLNTRQRF